MQDQLIKSPIQCTTRRLKIVNVTLTRMLITLLTELLITSHVCRTHHKYIIHHEEEILEYNTTSIIITNFLTIMRIDYFKNEYAYTRVACKNFV